MRQNLWQIGHYLEAQYKGKKEKWRIAEEAAPERGGMGANYFVS
jgi:hypothetical protein